MNPKRCPRVVIAKPGLDGHTRGAKLISLALRDAGMEVIYTGTRCTPEEIVNTAIQEDADLIGLSILSGAHMENFAEVLRLLKEKGILRARVIGGGIIPDEDVVKLKELGVAAIFGPGTKLDAIVQEVSSLLEAKIDDD